MPELTVSPTGSASWRVVASDGTLHASLAAVTAAGKVPFPGLDPGAFPRTFAIKTENGSSADGSPFYYATNKSAMSSDDAGIFVSGSGQTWSREGDDLFSIYAINNVWIRLTVSGDKAKITVDW